MKGMREGKRELVDVRHACHPHTPPLPSQHTHRVVEVEEELRALAHERRVVARDAARLGVVRDLSGDLAVRLEHAHEHEDLELADHRDVVPLLLRGHVLDVAAVRHGRVGALHNVERLDAETKERGHCVEGGAGAGGAGENERF